MSEKKSSKARTAIGCLVGLVLTGGFGWFVIDNMRWAAKNGNETAAVGGLKTIGAAQSLFRESDKEEDKNLDYGTLTELASAGKTPLIDSVLGSGTKNGYLFAVTYSRTSSEFLWYATARPALPHTTGDRYFAANQEGVTFYTVSQAFRMNSVDCTVPAGVLPVGK